MGTARREGGGGPWALDFDVETLDIPALDYRTASIFGVPIPPPLRIAIEPRTLRGELDEASGRVDLEFDAQFRFTAGPLYEAEPLEVQTTLTTGSSQGKLLEGQGRAREAGTGLALLAGVSEVPRTA